MSEIKIEQNNWDGILFPVQGRKDKVMIVVSGSDGGLEHAGKNAKFLCDNEIPALAFSLFKTKHSPKTLSLIPLEQLQSAIAYLCDNGYKKIGVQGVSKGAEYVLAAATMFQEISFVNIRTPSWFYSEGLCKQQPSGTSCWSYQGKELPYTPYENRKFHMFKELWKHKEFNILAFNTGKVVKPESVIPIEKVHAPILIQTLQCDTVWPSQESGEKLVQRLKENGFSYPYKLTCYEHMSHMMMEYCGSEIRHFIKSEKQCPLECAKERKQMGIETIEWIENIWK